MKSTDPAGKPRLTLVVKFAIAVVLFALSYCVYAVDLIRGAAGRARRGFLALKNLLFVARKQRFSAAPKWPMPSKMGQTLRRAAEYRLGRFAIAFVIVGSLTGLGFQQGPALSNYAAIIYGVVTNGAPFSGNALGQLYSSPRVIDVTAFCTAAGFGTYNSTTYSCTGSYDSVHQIGHGMCESITQANALWISATGGNTPLMDARAFQGTQLITSNCGTNMLYGGTAAATGSQLDGKLQLGTVTMLVDGPTTLPFFVDTANCTSTACAQIGTTAGPSTWATPGFLLPSQHTGIYGNGKDATIIIPCSTTTTGCQHDWPLRAFPVTSTNVVSNIMTVTLAANTLLAGGQNGAGTNSSAPISGFTGSSGTLSFTNTGTNGLYSGFTNAYLFGFTGANIGLNGQQCVISATGLTTNTFQCPVTGSGYSSGTGYISEANIWPQGGGLTGEYAFLVGSSLDNNNAAYLIRNGVTSNTFTVAVPTGTTSCAANCGTIYLGTAMIGWGVQLTQGAYIPQQVQAAVQSFAQRVEDLAVWGSSTQIPQGKTWPYGFIAFQNSNAGENAGANHIQSDFIAGMMLDLHGGSTDSGPWNDLRMINLTNLNAVRSTTAFGVAGAIRGIYNSSAIEGYPTGAITTSNGALGACTANCGQVSGTGNATFSQVVPGTQMVVTGSTCPSSLCTVLSVQSNTILTFTSTPGGASTSFAYGQPLACWLVDGQGPQVNQSPVFIANHPEACQDGFRLAANYVTRGVTIEGFLGGPSGGHADVNLVHAVAAGNSVLGSAVIGVDTQNGGAATTVLDDINGNSCLDLPLALYTWDSKGSPSYSCTSGTFTTGIQTINGLSHSFSATKSTPVGGTAIGGTATSPATAVTTFTISGFSANVTYKLHCSGTSVMATAGGAGTGIGIAYQTATTATSVDLHGLTATSTTTTQTGATGILSNTGANAIIADTTGTVTTPMNWYVDGTIFVGATAPSALNIGFYNINAADTNTIFGSCDLR